jgi:Carbohydrate phosphorylase
MMESINFRTGISASLSRTTQAALAEIPYRFYARNRHTTITSPMHSQSLPRTVARNRGRWLIDAELIKIEAPARTSAPEFNPRQWLLSGNPCLSKLITEAIGDRWMTHLEDLEQLAPIADDPLFQSHWRAVKQVNKQALANDLDRTQGISINVNSLFDLQLQPIGGHQRQLLNILHIIALFDRIKQHPEIDILPRTFIFGNLGELPAIEIEPTAETEDWLLPSSDYDWYNGAEELTAANDNRAILALIQSLAKVLAADPDVNGKLQVVYVPESAGLTNQMYAAADLTQQIATAAMEDIDLGSLKATVNGVLLLAPADSWRAKLLSVWTGNSRNSLIQRIWLRPV